MLFIKRTGAIGFEFHYYLTGVIVSHFSLLIFVLLNCRYYKVNEVQKFTYSRRKDTSKNDVTVSSCTHTTHNRFTALWNLSGKTRVSRYQKNIHPLLSS